jgi:hypothetical protein
LPVKKNVCIYETYQKPKTTCKYTIINPTVIKCENPSGVVTNALLSENFEYQIKDEENWNSIPKLKEDWSFVLQNQEVRFRVTIPLICSPEYDIDKAIIIQERE